MPKPSIEFADELSRAGSLDRPIVLFVGAGASSQVGVPTWGELMERVSEMLGEVSAQSKRKTSGDAMEQRWRLLIERSLEFTREADESKDLTLKQSLEDLNYRLAMASLQKWSKADKGQELLETLTAKAQPSALHEAIAEFPAKAIITTNFDNLLEEALEKAKRSYRVLTPADDPAYLARSELAVIKLFGQLGETEISFSSGPRFGSELRTYLRILLSTSLVVFVGFSVRSRAFRELFEKYGNTGDRVPDWLVFAEDDDPLQRSLWAGRGVRLLGGSLDEIADVFQELGRRLRQDVESNSEPQPVQRVFISHSVADGKIGLRIKRLLEAHGLKGVIARDELTSGRPPFESLDRAAETVDAAIVVLGKGTELRRASYVFELGYLIGRLGRDRVLVLVDDRSADLPTDIGALNFAVADWSKPRAIENYLRSWAKASKVSEMDSMSQPPSKSTTGDRKARSRSRR
jgi:NAD-dependent SIR2 family protein deacetylase